MRTLLFLAGLVLISISLPPFFQYPLLSFWLVLLGFIYFVLLSVFPRIWLYLLPVIVVGLDLTPYTGRLFYTELDLFFLLTISAGLLLNRMRFDVYRSSPASLVALAFLFLCCLTLSGWLTFLVPPRSSLGNPYLDSAYAYQLLKGLLWSILLVPMWGQHLTENKNRATNALITGIAMAAFLLAALTAWDHYALAGFADLASQPTSTVSGYPPGLSALFADMHLGSATLGAVSVALAAYVLWASVFLPGPLRALSYVAYIALVYVSTVAGSLFALITTTLALFALLLWHAHKQQQPKPAALPFTSAISATSIVSALIFTAFSSTPLTNAASPTGTSSDQVSSTWATTLIGHGAGAFPQAYLGNQTQTESVTTSFSISQKEHANTLLLHGGSDIAVGQRVGIQQHRDYQAILRLRANASGSLSIALCERNLSPTDDLSTACSRKHLFYDGNNELFKDYELTIPSEQVGNQTSWPTSIYLQNSSPGSVVEIDSIELLSDGFNQLRNSSFYQGMDYWFFYAPPNTPGWRLDNMYQRLQFEHGIVGLALFLALILLLARSTFTAQRSHDSLLPAYASCVIGLCVFGLWHSPLDSPRVAWLFYFALFSMLADFRMRARSNNA